MPEDKRSDTNYGIQAHHVTAEVQAVGNKAHAQKFVTGAEVPRDLVSAVSTFESALRAVKLPPESRKKIEEHLKDITSEASKPEADKTKIESNFAVLKGFIESTAHFIQEAAGLLKPLKEIAVVIGVGAALFGA